MCQRAFLSLTARPPTPSALKAQDHREPDQRAADILKAMDLSAGDLALVGAEVSLPGFDVVPCGDPFLKPMAELTDRYCIGAAGMWLLIALRPR